MSGAGDRSGRPSFDLRANRVRVVAGVVAAVAVIALLGQALLANPRPSPGPSGQLAVASPSVAPSGAATAAPPSTGEPAGPWADLAVPPYQPVAELVPSNRDRLGVAADASFEVHARNGARAADLAKGLTVQPPVRFTIKPGADASRAIVQPAAPLQPGARYRWELTAADGSLAGSWLFTVRQPLHVVTTLPGDKAVEVPLNTGIEVTFDQDGTTGIDDHVTIDPAVAGRFEAHGRTWVFVPEHPLAERTIYTVTVSAGVGATGSTETLEKAVTFRFETAIPGAPADRVEFERPILEVRPGAQPVAMISLRSIDDEGGVNSTAASGSFTVDVYRLPGFDAAADAAKRLTGAAGWAVSSPQAIVPTAGLTRVERVKATAVDADGSSVLPIAVSLTAGWYVVEIDQPSGPAQMLLQVTNVAAFALLTSDTLVGWVNDLAANAVLPGATISLLGGNALGTTVADGTVRIPASAVQAPPRPGELEQPPAARLLKIQAPDGRAVILALGLPFSYGYDDFGVGSGRGSRYWTLFRSDRDTYRQTDTIHVSGLLRERADRSVPTNVSLQLFAVDSAAAIMTVPVTLSARGTITADIKLVDLPRDSYQLELHVGGSTVSTLWIYVAAITKPAYQIDVTTDRLAYIVGQPVEVSATVRFYDGTAAPGIDLELSAFGTKVQRTTDGSGHVEASFVAALDADDPYLGGVGSTSVAVRPARPEEGQISGEASVWVVPSTSWVTARGTIANGRFAIDGHLSIADVAALEASLAQGGYPDDLSGAAIAAGTLHVDVYRWVEHRTQTGTRYDYIEKKVVPAYESDSERVKLGSYPATSTSSGAFHVSVALPNTSDQYEATVSAKDAQGRTFVANVELTATGASATAGREPYIADGGGCGGSPSVLVGVGQRVDATIHAGDGSVASGGRFLYLVSRQGSLDIAVQDAAAFHPLFSDADLPSLDVVGVWQHGDGFDVAGALARVDPAGKQLRVTVKPDAARYHPGDLVTVHVTTTAPNGDPIAADVILQGVDQKLYTLNQAFDVDPVGDLFVPNGTGIQQSFATHASPHAGPGGCGDGGGDGGRNDFRDAVTFQRITTDASGNGTATFRLSDDLTTWHLIALAAASNLDVGQGSILVPVGLDFFAEPILASEYLSGDQPVLRVRGYGDALVAGDSVRYTVTSPDLQLNESVSGAAFQAVSVQLPALVAGTYRITIAAEATHAGHSYHDTLTRTIRVVPSRLSAVTNSIEALGTGFVPKGGAQGRTTYVITDAGRGSLISLLEQLASSTSARFDSAAAADLARSMLIEQFGFDPAALPSSGYDAGRYQQGGISLLPYAGVDLELSALAAVTVPDRIATGDLSEWLRDGAELGTRERDLMALAAKAGLGEDVAADLQAIDPAPLAIREQLWLALGLASVGDDDGARTIERDLLQQHGQRLGQWVRLQVGATSDDSLAASGLLLVLAARLGDPLAGDVARYLVEQPSKERVFPLELAAYAEAALARLPRTAARFAYTIDGTRTEVALDPGGSVALSLVPSQVASLRLERLGGSLDVVTSWQTSDVPTSNAPGLTVTRTVTPAVGSADGTLVRVTLTVAFGPQAPRGCYVLTDLLPSGLAPVAATAAWDEDENGNRIGGPYEVDGQRVAWCVDPALSDRTFAYAARVVSPGTYRWEPAVIQSIDAPELRSATEATTFTIR